MPRGVYKRSKNVVIKLPKKKKAAKKLDVHNVEKINKGIDLFNKRMAEKPYQNAEQMQAGQVPWSPAQDEVDKLRKDYHRLVSESEGLRRVIGTQKETIDTLCRAMIEVNAVEGRWR